MTEIGFIQSLRDSCVYIKALKDGSNAYLLIYVDDLLVAAKDKQVIVELKQKILGMEIRRDRAARKLWMGQESYLRKVLELYRMEDSN